MKNKFIIIFLMLSISCFAQEDKKGTITVKKVDTAKSELVLVDPDIQPSFPGGEGALRTYISKKIKYPRMEKEAGIQGTVFMSFDVEEDGSITDIKVLRGVSGGPGFDKEGLRVIKMMPKWIPAKLNGKPFKTRMIVPIIFKLG